MTLTDTCIAFSKALERSKLDGHDTHDIELYVEHKLHFIHAKIDLQPTITGLVTMDKYISQMDKRMTDTLGSTLSKNLVRRLDKIVKKLKRVITKNQLSTRDRRAIELIGNLISDIFGNPGPADWKQAKANFLALQNALKKLNDNTSDDHNTIDMNSHIIEKHNNELRELSTAINRNQNDIVYMNQSMSDLRLFFEISTLADTLESQVNSLVEIKIDSIKGYCSDRALSKEFLISNLQSLEANKAGLGPVFGSWEWREYYKHNMCTIAMNEDALWITLRIPLVIKSEKLVRIIPSPEVGLIMARALSYGLQVALFKEKKNDNFHIMTQSALDLCNILGSVRTCGVRDARFKVTSNTVIPIEFNVNKFLMIGLNSTQISLMEKCANAIAEHTISTDSVVMVPNNCSYISNSMSIGVREADIMIMKEIGILQFDKFEVSGVHSEHFNHSQTSIEKIAGRTSNNVFEKNKKDIDTLLNEISTKHDTLSSSYSIEKWLLSGAFLLLVAVLALSKIKKLVRSKRVTTVSESGGPVGSDRVQMEQPKNISDMSPPHIMNLNSLQDISKYDTQQQPDQQQQQTQQQQQNQQGQETKSIDNGLYADHEYQEVPILASKLNLGPRPERSQFFKK